MHPFKAIGLKLISALLFAAMSALVRQLGDVAPIGQMVFFRSAFAILPVVLVYAIRGELATAVRTSRPLGKTRHHSYRDTSDGHKQSSRHVPSSTERESGHQV